MIKSKYTLVRARMKKSGEGDSAAIIDYLKPNDWHPKVLILMHRVVLANEWFGDFATRGIDASVAFESGDGDGAGPDKKRQKKGDEQMIAAVRDGNSELAEAMTAAAKTKAAASQLGT